MYGKTGLNGVCAMVLTLAAGVAVAAGDAQKEATTAMAHAEYSAKADSIKMQHTHLQHVVNCLVGEDSESFDGSVGNPCEGQGGGAINDAEDGSDMQMQLEQAADLATIGTRLQDSTAAKHVAMAVAALLESSTGAGN